MSEELRIGLAKLLSLVGIADVLGVDRVSYREYRTSYNKCIELLCSEFGADRIDAMKFVSGQISKYRMTNA